MYLLFVFKFLGLGIYLANVAWIFLVTSLHQGKEVNRVQPIYNSQYG
jgi:hypothetical protein